MGGGGERGAGGGGADVHDGDGKHQTPSTG